MGCASGVKRYHSATNATAELGDQTARDELVEHADEIDSSSLVQWEVETACDQWCELDASVSVKLTEAYDLELPSLVYFFEGDTYEIDLETGIQSNWNTGHRCRIRKRMPARCLTATAQPKSVIPCHQTSSQQSPLYDGTWQWEDSDGIWNVFEPEVAQLLFAARHLGKDEIIYADEYDHFYANLDGWVQTNLRTGVSQLLRWVPREKTGAKLQWHLHSDIWIDYDDEASELLIEAKGAGSTSVSYLANGHEYHIDFLKMEQKCVSIGAGPGAIRSMRIVESSSVQSAAGGLSSKVTNPRERHANGRRKSFDPPPHHQAHRNALHTRASRISTPASKMQRIAATSQQDSFLYKRATGTSCQRHAQANKRATGASESPADRLQEAVVDWPKISGARQIAQTLFAELAVVPLDERKKAFKAACLRWHPDKNPNDGDVATEIFQFLQKLKMWYLRE